MKILLVSTAWPWPTRKGYQLRLLQLAEAFAARHEVTPEITPHTPPPT